MHLKILTQKDSSKYNRQKYTPKNPLQEHRFMSLESILFIRCENGEYYKSLLTSQTRISGLWDADRTTKKPMGKQSIVTLRYSMRKDSEYTLRH